MRHSKDAYFTWASSQQRSGDSSQRNQAKENKQIKVIQTAKEEIKLSLFVDDMILYVQNQKINTFTEIKLINDFNEVARHTAITGRSGSNYIKLN